MRYLVVILFLCSFFSYSQELYIPIDEIENDTTIKIVLITADWCSICKKQKEIIDGIDPKDKDSILIYEFDLDYRGDIELNNNLYSYKSTGLNIGNHEFSSFLFEDESISTPTAVVLNSNNQIIGRYSCLLNESDFIALFIALSDLR